MRIKNYFPRKSLEEFLESSFKEKNIYLIYGYSGSGKTTLILNFVKNKNNLYLKLSETHTDPVKFFEEVSDKAFKKFGCTLPKLSVDFLLSLEKFTFEYFSLFFKNLKDAIIVFDDFQNIKNNKRIITIFRSLIKNFNDKKIILISKEEFPFEYFSWEIEKNIQRICPNFFKLTESEIQKFFEYKYHKSLTPEELENVYLSTEGILGKLLLSEEKSFNNLCINLENKLKKILTEEELNEINYLHLFPVVNENLLRNNPQKERILNVLEKLYIENLFIEKIEKGFVFHDILKDYLKISSDEIYGKNKNEKYKEVVKILYKNGFLDDALKILMELEDYDTYFQLLSSKITDYVYSGKIYSVERYIKFLENTDYFNHPIILFARGYIQKFYNPKTAVNLFLKAISIFEKEGNLIGEKLIIGELFDIAQFYGEDFKIGGRFLNKAEKLIKNTETFEEIDIRLLSYMGIIYLLYKGDTKKSIHCFKLIDSIIGNQSELPIFFSYIKLYASIAFCAGGLTLEAKESFKEAEKIFENSNKNPNDIFMYNFLSSIYELFIGEFEKSVKRAKETLEYSRNWGLTIHEEHLITRIIEGLLCMGNTLEAEEYFQEIDNVAYRTKFSRATTLQLESQKLFIEKNFEMAFLKSENSVQLFQEINGKSFEMATMNLTALSMAEMGNLKDAERILLYLIKWSKKNKAILQEFSSLFYLSYVYYLSNKNKETLKTLKYTLKLGKNYELFALYNQIPYIVSTLLDIALENNIEPEFVKKWVKFHNLKLNKSSKKIKIYTFGKLKVIVDGKELLPKDWKGEKPLKLLEVIIALGGEGVPIDRIISILWDEQDYVKSKQNFEFNLRKLRKILNDKNKEILILKNKKIYLNRDFVWLDLWEFEDLYYDLQFKNNNGELARRLNKLNKLKSLYKGKFLELEEDLIFDNTRNLFEEMFQQLNRNNLLK